LLQDRAASLSLTAKEISTLCRAYTQILLKSLALTGFNNEGVKVSHFYPQFSTYTHFVEK
jgi:hypothetical protein